MVVFDSAVEGYFLTHYDFLAKLEDTTSLPPGPTGLHPLPDMLVRLSRAPVVSITRSVGALQVWEVSWRSHAICVLRVAKKRFCRTLRSEQVWFLGVVQWRVYLV